MRAVLAVFWVMILLIAAGCQAQEIKHCAFTVRNVTQESNTLSLKLDSDRECPGYRLIAMLKNGKKVIYRANFTSKIVDNAPPMGFSVLLPGADEFESLGVDEHLRQLEYMGIRLSTSTKISDLNDTTIEIKWVWKTRMPEVIEKMAVKSSSEKIILMRQSESDCATIYDFHLMKPTYGKNPDDVLSFERFKKWCMRQWYPLQKSEVIRLIMDVPSAIETVSRDGRKDIVNFLSRGGKSESSEGNSCRIDVGLLYRNHLRSVEQHYNGEFVVKKINGESFERKARGYVTVPKGVYVIEILNSHIHGRSEPIDCKGGRIHAFVYVVSHI